MRIIIWRCGTLHPTRQPTFIKKSTPWEGRRFPLDYLDPSEQADRQIPALHDLSHVAGREPYNLQDIYDMFAGLDLCTLQILRSTSQRQVVQDLDFLYFLDRDVSDAREI